MSKIARAAFHIFYLFPVKKNRVFFDAYKGKQFACNPKYVFLELYARYGNKLEYIWNLKKPELIAGYDNVKTVERYSFKYFYYMMTSKVFVTNLLIHNYTPFRKSQIAINTWHAGGAYKKVGNKDKNTDEFQNYSAKFTAEKYLTHFISSSKRFSEEMSESFYIPMEKFLNIGMPRNDIFFKDYSAARKKVRDFLNIPEDVGIMLYAPTYRKYNNREFVVDMDIEAVLSALSKKFNKPFECLLRGHHGMTKFMHTTDITDVSTYPDMQELLCAIDVLITDYSSSVWDFSFTGNPSFIYVPDIEEYTADQGLYIPVKEWPFPWAKDNNTLVECIAEFDVSYYKKVVKIHLDDLGSFETGTASKAVGDIIGSSIFKEK